MHHVAFRFAPGTRAHLKPVEADCFIIKASVGISGRHDYFVEYWMNGKLVEQGVFEHDLTPLKDERKPEPWPCSSCGKVIPEGYFSIGLNQVHFLCAECRARLISPTCVENTGGC